MPANVTDVLGRGNDREHVSMLEMSRDFLETECLRVATTLLGYGPVEVERIARVDFGIVDQIGASKEVGVLPPIAECGRLLQRSREKLHHWRNVRATAGDGTSSCCGKPIADRLLSWASCGVRLPVSID
jgi:hypothetical protein